MKNKFLVGSAYGDEFETIEEAEAAAKRRTQENCADTAIWKLAAVVKYPVPDYEIVKF